MNLCIFGAVALGPTIGGLQAASGTWRPLFWSVAAVGALAWLLSLLTYEDAPAQDRSAPWDIVAVALAGCGCASAWICLVIAAGGALLATLLFVLGSGRLQTPDLERWAGGEPAWMSPPLLGRLRRAPAPEEHARRPSAADTGARSERAQR